MAFGSHERAEKREKKACRLYRRHTRGVFLVRACRIVIQNLNVVPASVLLFAFSALERGGMLGAHDESRPELADDSDDMLRGVRTIREVTEIFCEDFFRTVRTDRTAAQDDVGQSRPPITYGIGARSHGEYSQIFILQTTPTSSQYHSVPFQIVNPCATGSASLS